MKNQCWEYLRTFFSTYPQKFELKLKIKAYITKGTLMLNLAICLVRYIQNTFRNVL